MERNKLIDELVLEYFNSRPNLDIENQPLCVFFLACSGAGKSTLRKQLVDLLGFTYVCNDEVRELLAKHSEAATYDIGLKEVIAKTWAKIIAESPNKSVIFDNNIIQYYANKDSYYNVAKEQKIPIFVINIEVPEVTLKERIIARGVIVAELLSELPGQFRAYKQSLIDIESDVVIGDAQEQSEVASLIEQLKNRA